MAAMANTSPGIPEPTPFEPDIATATEIVRLLCLDDKLAVIAGGYPRDLWMERAPKDIDIIVAATDIDEVLEILLASTDNSDDWEYFEDGASNDQPEPDDRLLAVFSNKIIGIDVIVYSAPTLRRALEEFDYNINQFILQLNGDPIWVGTPGTFGVLTAVRPEYVGDTRRTKMGVIAADCNWSVPV